MLNAEARLSVGRWWSWQREELDGERLALVVTGVSGSCVKAMAELSAGVTTRRGCRMGAALFRCEGDT